ncbi:MAG: hypothetical protein ABFD10_22900 [Prolixibacteraceae bacterium]
MKRATATTVHTQGDVYWRIEAKRKSVKRNPRRESSVRDPRSELNEVKSM